MCRRKMGKKWERSATVDTTEKRWNKDKDIQDGHIWIENEKDGDLVKNLTCKVCKLYKDKVSRSSVV